MGGGLVTTYCEIIEKTEEKPALAASPGVGREECTKPPSAV